MKIILILFTIQCFVHIKAYKFVDSEEYIPKRFQFKPSSKHQYDLESFLHTSNNRQPSLYDDPEESLSLQETLAALAQASQDENDSSLDSTEYNLEDLLNSRNLYEDDIESKAGPIDEESESHSSLVAGHQYVSGGAGEGKQHLKPDGHVDNKAEVKSDEDLPAYCDPPNPCPIGYVGDDCDPRPYSDYTAEFSKRYQEQQNCMCDDDHNECSKSAKNMPMNDLIKNIQNLQLSKTDVRKLNFLAFFFLFYFIN